MGGGGEGAGPARLAALGAAGLLALAAAALFAAGAGDGPGAFALAALAAVTTFWMGLGAATGLLGLRHRAAARPEAPFEGRAVLLLPICNEDPEATFARLAAMDADLVLAGLAPQVDVAVLSDTRDPAAAAAEAAAWERLVAETDAAGRLFYRRRTENRGRKAGNVADFIRRSGAAYEVAVILDADSLMSAETVGRLLRRMAGDPRLGLVQTVPAILRARSRFGRMTAFAGALYGPAFARGLARLQGRAGPFWGHNAAIRVRAFAASCGLPELAGRPPFGGHVLSHDYVEAALLARAGWTVRLDPDLGGDRGGSYEEGPDHLLAFARRDRRWCQGNLQHLRILAAPGLLGWSRFALLQGIAAYLVPPLWLAFVVLGLALGAATGGTAALAVLVALLLLGPKLAVAWGEARRAEAFGGRLHLAASAVAEVLQSSLVAPVLLMFQVRSVLQVILGRDGGWPAQSRADGALSWGDGWRAAWWVSAWGLGLLALGLWRAPALVPWLLPLALPMAAGPLIVTWTSRPPASRLFLTPEERNPPAALRRADGVLARWTRGAAQPVALPAAPPAAIPAALPVLIARHA